MTTVYFATNRLVTKASDPDIGYEAVMVPQLDPSLITYGQATVDEVSGSIVTRYSSLLRNISLPATISRKNIGCRSRKLPALR